MRTARTVLVLAVALLVALPAVAQEKPKRKGKRGQLNPVSRTMLRVDTLRRALEGLDLTAEQQEKLAKIREDFGAKMQEIFDKLGDLLSEEQRAAIGEAARQAREAGKRGRPFFVAVEAAVKLTDEQKEKIDKVAPELAAAQRKLTRGIKALLSPAQREKLKAAMAPKRQKAKKAGEKKKEPK